MNVVHGQPEMIVAQATRGAVRMIFGVGAMRVRHVHLGVKAKAPRQRGCRLETRNVTRSVPL
jgi:hypothetical protein